MEEERGKGVEDPCYVVPVVLVEVVSVSFSSFVVARAKRESDGFHTSVMMRR